MRTFWWLVVSARWLVVVFLVSLPSLGVIRRFVPVKFDLGLMGVCLEVDWAGGAASEGCA